MPTKESKKSRKKRTLSKGKALQNNKENTSVAEKKRSLPNPA